MKTTQEKPSAARDAGQPDRLEYYSGNRPMGFPASPGTWGDPNKGELDILTTPDGRKWRQSLEDVEAGEQAPNVDGTGVHWLEPLEDKQADHEARAAITKAEGRAE